MSSAFLTVELSGKYPQHSLEEFCSEHTTYDLFFQHTKFYQSKSLLIYLQMEAINKNSDQDLFQFLEDELKLFEETCEEFNGIFIIQQVQIVINISQHFRN